MPITFDSVLNVVIPVGIVLFLLFLFYTKFKDTFDAMFSAFGRLFTRMTQGGKAQVSEQYEMVYKV